MTRLSVLSIMGTCGLMGLLMSGALAAVKSLRGMSDEPHVHSLQTGTQTEA